MAGLLAVDFTALALGMAGLVTTLAAPLLSSRVANRQAHAARLRDLRVSLYVDLAEYTQRREASIESVTDEYGISTSKGPDGLVHPERLTARVRLLAPKAVRDSWVEFVTAEDRMFWELSENCDYNSRGEPYLDFNQAAVVDVRRTVSALQERLRAAMSNSDIAD